MFRIRELRVSRGESHGSKQNGNALTLSKAGFVPINSKLFCR